MRVMREASWGWARLCHPADATNLCMHAPHSFHADISIPGLMPGQIATPVRLGRARQGIFNPGVAELAGLDAERIVQVCSMTATSSDALLNCLHVATLRLRVCLYAA